jgi:cytochrome c nitrite reductase small subunit
VTPATPSPGLDLALPRPHGWIGTTDAWAQGIGLALGVVALVVLALAWRAIRAGGGPAASTSSLFLGLAVLPLVLTFVGYQHGFERSKTVAACRQCHVMGPFVDDLRNVGSASLAATHYKNRYIQEYHCYTCHSDYGMFGSLQAKLAGVGHVVRHVTGTYARPIKLASPYSNLRCLECHGRSQKFLTSPAHPGEALPALVSGTLSCLVCHGPAHTPAGAA